MTSRKLVLIDAYSLLFRAHFANPHFTTADGKPTGALFGFSNMLLALLNSQKPDSVIVCWDAPQKTNRKAEFEAYKAHRPETDPQLKAQMPDARRFTAAFGLQSAELGGFEADDLIGTLTVRGLEHGYRVVILTGDSDQLQLVREGVTVEICQRGVTDVKVYDSEAVIERYGIPPERIPDWKGLVGDTSDNIPGVAGIGEKTATALLQTWGTMENILEHVSEVMPNKARTSLESNPEVATLSKRLATIVCDAPIESQPEPYVPNDAIWQQVRDIFTEFQFKSLLSRLPKSSVPEPVSDTALALDFDSPQVAIHTVMSQADFDTALKAIADYPTIALFAFLSDDNPLTATISRLGFSVSPEEGFVVALKMGPESSSTVGLFDEPEENAGFAIELPTLKNIVDGKKLLAHNAKPLYQALYNIGISPDKIPLELDTMVAAYLLDSNRSGYSLADLSIKYLQEHANEALLKSSESDAPAHAAALIYRLAKPMRTQITELGMTDALEKVDQPLVSVLASVERAGLLIDRNYLSTLSIRLHSEMEGLAADIYAAAGEQFNIGSTKQLQTILFDKLQLPTGKKTKSGFSTGADLLEQLAAEFPIAQQILEYREISKMKSTYADALVKLCNPQTGRVHTRLNQTVASTGRLSSSDPNLQNIPVRSELGREIRRAFIAPPGRLLISCDYSQIELRVLAHMSGDATLSEAFLAHEDIHAATASKVFDVPLSEVTRDQRGRAKTINFAVIYGQGAFALANVLGVDNKTASNWIKEYFNRLPGVQKFIAETTDAARKDKFVTTLLGRRRYLPEMDSPNHAMRQFAERAAVNAPIQGTAADIMKLAMVQAYYEVEANWGDSCKMLLQVHDELLFEVDDNAKVPFTAAIKAIMESVYPLDVPLIAEEKSGKNWADMS